LEPRLGPLAHISLACGDVSGGLHRAAVLGQDRVADAQGVADEGEFCLLGRREQRDDLQPGGGVDDGIEFHQWVSSNRRATRRAMRREIAGLPRAKYTVITTPPPAMPYGTSAAW